MTKVKVSKVIGNVLDEYVGAFDATLIDLVKRHCNGKLRDNEIPLYDLNPIELSLAIANGHEVELSPLDKMELKYSDILRNRNIYYDKGDINNATYYSGYLKAMEEISEMLELDLSFGNVEFL